MDINEKKGDTSNQTGPENPPLPIPPIETPNHKSNSDDSDNDKQIELKKSRPETDYKFITEIVVAVTALVVACSSIVGNFYSFKGLELTRETISKSDSDALFRDRNNRERFKLDSVFTQAQMTSLESQVNALREQNNVMKTQLRLLFEPHISVEPTSPIDLNKEPLQFEYKITNNSNSTVRILEKIEFVYFNDRPAKFLFEDPDRVKSKIGGDFDVTRKGVIWNLEPVYFTVEDKEKIIYNVLRDNWRLYWGITIWYQDPFDKNKIIEEKILTEIFFKGKTVGFDFRTIPLPTN
jgi:hypothetical protein